MDSSIKALIKEDHETSLIHFFPALDKTAKKRRPNKKVGDRIRSFLDDEFDIISDIAVRNIFRVTCDGISFPQAIYKFGRTSIAHEGELDPRLNFENQTGLVIGHTWNLPPSFILGLVMSVVLAPENSSEKLEHEYSVSIHGTNYQIQSLWGQRQKVREDMEERYGHSIFK